MTESTSAPQSQYHAALRTIALIVAIALVAYVAWRLRHRRADIPTIVTNRVIWGPQFPVVLSVLPAWREVGEQELTIVGDRLIGERRLDNEQVAEATRSRLRTLLARSPPTLVAIGTLFRKWRAVELDVERLSAIAADQPLELVPVRGGFRLAATVPEAVLSPRLTARVLTREIGTADDIRRFVIGSGGDDRTRIVTEYRYQADAMRFMSSNYAPIVDGTTERLIERAVLKVTTIASMIGQ